MNHLACLYANARFLTLRLRSPHQAADDGHQAAVQPTRLTASEGALALDVAGSQVVALRCFCPGCSGAVQGQGGEGWVPSRSGAHTTDTLAKSLASMPRRANGQATMDRCTTFSKASRSQTAPGPYAVLTASRRTRQTWRMAGHTAEPILDAHPQLAYASLSAAVVLQMGQSPSTADRSTLSCQQLEQKEALSWSTASIVRPWRAAHCGAQTPPFRCHDKPVVLLS